MCSNYRRFFMSNDNMYRLFMISFVFIIYDLKQCDTYGQILDRKYIDIYKIENIWIDIRQKIYRYI